MEDVIQRIKSLMGAPSEPGEFDAWLLGADAVEFLKDNLADDDLVVYAGADHTFIHAVLVPAERVEPPDVEDLMAWNFGIQSRSRPMVQMAWGTFCGNVSRDELGFLSLHRVFQVVRANDLPTTLDCSCALAFRAAPQEMATLLFRFFEPRGERTPSKPTLRHAEVRFGATSGHYELSTDFRAMPLDVPGVYKFAAFLEGRTDALGFSQFEVIVG